MDAKFSFFNDFIKEKVYDSQPPWIEDRENLDYLFKLKRALYDLKQAPRTPWWLFD